ncbi:hypothetical protein BDZ45DRAFT_724519 [Acephala macrosclerotiorum]|nr:hypothetical protein BDZ45DRAFT_724519 [Acephala macrosclerotiorum]
MEEVTETPPTLRCNICDKSFENLSPLATSSIGNGTGVPDLSRALAIPSANPSVLATRQTDATRHIQYSVPANPDPALSSSLDNVARSLESEVSSSMLPEYHLVQYDSAVAMTLSDSVAQSSSAAIPSATYQPPLSQASSDKHTQSPSAYVPQSGGAGWPINFSSLEYMDALNLVERLCKAFGPRNIQPSLNKSYLLCKLRFYPNMMLSGDPPPFIHRNYGYGIDAPAQAAKPAPLKNCANIILWYSKKDNDNIKFIWRTVKAETERLLEEHESYNDEDAVAALQAMTLYLLLRISEDNKEVTNFDILLIKTMIMIATRVNRRFPNYNKAFPSRMPSWEDWMLAESLRRTVTVLCLIELLFEMYSVIGFQKYDGSLLAGLSLPCGRELWRASTRTEWESKYTAQQDREAGTKDLTYKDLTNVQLQVEGTLNPWLSQLDDFGTLVMAAAGIQP